MNNIKIWAHRGASAYAPENTMEAFKLAIEQGADGIELDVQLTKDNEIVVIHDETLQRVSDGFGYVKDFTLEELRKFNYNKTHPEYEWAEIPILKDVLELLKDTALELNIELKTGVYFYPDIEKRVLDLVSEYEMQDRVWYSSFNHYSIKKIKELDFNAKAGLLYSDGIYEPAQYALNLGAQALHPYARNLIYPDLMQKCKQDNIKVHTWTVHEYKDIMMCIKSGVDALITNTPDKVRLFTQKQAEGRYPYENPFEGNESRSFYLFGAGYQGQHFMKRFTDRYVPEKIIDNSQSKWGTTLNNIIIDGISAIKAGDCIIIACDCFVEIVKQLKSAGINSYYFYNENCEWN